MAQQVIGAAQIQATADQLDDLKMQALDVLSRYMQHSTELQATGGLDGRAGVANVVTAEEISTAQREMNMRWETLIAALRNSAPDFTNIDEQSAQQITSVAGGLRFT
ncbi:hypothetical protein [Mycobacterium lehmannii]|uniref:hypothetical protein n=1 Tax=Mycobacterium lehmannii TaxID=2048550 RepID=UPI000B944D7C|nr:hypothetical protein [Mycobacterium lehmannii]